jgi:hypothetical protein
MIGGIIQNYTDFIHKKACNNPVAESEATTPYLTLFGAVMTRKI